ncbi:unnamed protein product [Brassica napus]|uniref:(rape) hypothetical protein n=1 Tax=Brassica napus TaxID=3708 RepID=A0A816Y026_BRANA|nr:unnamed protein product [Brassica napus]
MAIERRKNTCGSGLRQHKIFAGRVSWRRLRRRSMAVGRRSRVPHVWYFYPNFLQPF